MSDSWATVELPILRAVREAELAASDVGGAARRAVSDLPARVFEEAIYSLHEDGYLESAITSIGNGRVMVHVRRLLPRGRRAIGQWPSGDLSDLWVDELYRRIEEEPDEEEKGRLRRLADVAGEVSKDVLTGVLTNVATRGTGLG